MAAAKTRSSVWGLGIEHEFLLEKDGEILSTASLFANSEASSYHSQGNNRKLPPITYVKMEAGSPSLARATAPKSGHSRRQLLFIALLALNVSSSSDDDDLMADMENNRAKNTPIDLYSGDIIAIVEYNWRIAVFRSKEPRVKPNKMTQAETLNALIYLVDTHTVELGRTSVMIDEMNDDDITYDRDGDYVEARSTQPYKATVASVVNQVRAAERKATAELCAKCKNVRTYPWSGYVDRQVKEARYAGSYHVWITLPHATRAGSTGSTGKLRRDILTKHALMSHMFQWIEPIITAAYATGDPRALGKPDGSFSRASVRSEINVYSGYATSPVDRIAVGRPVTNHLMWYNNKEDAAKGVRHRVSGPSENNWRLTVVVDGVRLPYSVCEDIPRLPYAAGWDGYYDNRTVQLRMWEAIPGLGADIRTDGLCKALHMPIKLGWRGVWIRVGGVKKKIAPHLQLHFIRDSTGELVDEFPLDEKEWESMLEVLKGVEFRALDNFPSSGLEPLVRTLALIAAAADAQVEATSGNKDHKKIVDRLVDKRAQSNAGYTAALAAVRAAGCHADVGRAYARRLYKELGIGKPPSGPLPTAYEMLVDVASRLHRAHGNSAVIKALDPRRGKADKAPVPVNFNQQGWEDAFDSLAVQPTESEMRADAKWAVDLPFFAAFKERQKLTAPRRPR